MNLGELLAQGGWAMVPIYLCSLAALTVFIRKVFQFRAARLADVSWIPGAMAHIREGDLAGVRAHCEAVRHPAARVVEAVVHNIERKPERAEPEGVRVGTAELQRLEHQVGLLAFIAQAAPLLGLLGTVFGMVDLFAGLGAASGAQVDASLLSSGIWKALLTTAAGLMVAVPTLAAHSWLIHRVDRTRAVMTDSLQQILTLAPPASLPEPPVSLVARRVADAV